AGQPLRLALGGDAGLDEGVVARPLRLHRVPLALLADGVHPTQFAVDALLVDDPRLGLLWLRHPPLPSASAQAWPSSYCNQRLASPASGQTCWSGSTVASSHVLLLQGVVLALEEEGQQGAHADAGQEQAPRPQPPILLAGQDEEHDDRRHREAQGG